jgi:holo-[acyl-carrier protein] synthase
MPTGPAMILGVGSDLIDIRRIEKTIERFGDRFLDRIFTETRRFAAKEAAAKALGTGFRRGVFWRDLGVVNLPSGQPGLLLTGGALRRLEAITPPGMVARLDLSLTDEPPMAQAVVIISALPRPAEAAPGGNR